jgi:hypothetical protein
MHVKEIYVIFIHLFDSGMLLHGRIWCSKKKKKKKEYAYLPTHTQKSWVGFGQTEIFLRMA